MVKLVIKDITFEPLIYPRKLQDEQRKLPFWKTTATYKRAMKAGAKFPAILVARIEGIIYLVDGYHRLLAASQLKRRVIEAEFIRCKNFDEAYIYALQQNNRNGQPLDEYERATAIIRLKDKGYKLDDIGKILCMTVADVKLMTAHRIKMTNTGEVVIKTPFKFVENLRDDITSDDQKVFSGNSQVHIIDEVCQLIERDLLDIDNPVVVKSVERLYGLLRDIMIPARPGRRMLVSTPPVGGRKK